MDGIDPPSLWCAADLFTTEAGSARMQIKEPYMKVAIPYDDGQIFQHFGQTRAFRVYEIDNQNVVGSDMALPDEGLHCALGGWLKQQGVEALICGGIGGGAINALGSAGIQVFPGVTGDADAAADAFAAGDLQFNPNAQCAGHEHEAGHTCAHHHN